jgi:hypothetical protein
MKKIKAKKVTKTKGKTDGESKQESGANGEARRMRGKQR